MVRTIIAFLVVTFVVSLHTPALGAAVSGVGTWQTTLQPRDLDGDREVDAFYDVELNVTWLRDANFSGGELDWIEANSRVAALRLGGHSGWRLPTMVDTYDAPVTRPDGCNLSFSGGTDCGFNVQTKSGTVVYSELAHLWYVSLGNLAPCPPGDETCRGFPNNPPLPGAGLTNTGEFVNFQSFYYWLAPEYVMPGTAWNFATGTGFQIFTLKTARLYVVPLHDGDVGSPVPEPATAAMLLAGLGCIVSSLRKTRCASAGT